VHRIRLRLPSASLVISLLALFVSLGGVSYGLATGAIGTREIRNNAIRGADVRNDNLTGADIRESSLGQVPSARAAAPVGPAGGGLAGSFPNPVVAPGAINGARVADDSLTGADVLESSLGQVPSAASATTASPSGAAGGDLAGTYPNPTVGPDAISGPEVADNGLTGADVGESTLGPVPTADRLGGELPAAFLHSSVYKRESAVGPGTRLGDNTNVIGQACDPGDVLLSGGPANVSATSDMVESFPSPASTNSWSARIFDNGTADNFSVVILCVDQ
jgi:hypothetical protein